MFKSLDGVTPLRPFANAEAMDEELVRRWNDRVGEHDRVYHLGDVAIARRSLQTLRRLKGRLKLVKGNHDIFNLKDYAEFFDDVCGSYVMDGIIMSHIPIHPESLKTRFGTNVHGHLHAHHVMVTRVQGSKTIVTEQRDTRYLNVCVEQTDYAPLSLEEVRERIAAQRS